PALILGLAAPKGGHGRRAVALDHRGHERTWDGSQPRPRRMGTGTRMTTLHSPAKSERTAAAAVHIGAIFAPIWVPLVAYVVTHRTKKFIAEHARQSLTETLILNVCIGAAMVGSFCYTVWRVWSIYQEGLDKVDWGSAIW